MHRGNGFTQTLAMAAALAVVSAAPAAAQARIQLAILLDTSNSMDGLIDQAKSQLWKVVNELARARKGAVHPALEVALYEYGNDGLSAAEGYIRMVSPLTTDLDRVSEGLFSLTTNGGDEYCGMVIDRAVKDLAWSPAPDALKVIYIAGNEPFTQGSLSYIVSDARAAKRGIMVNTIFCGPSDEGAATGWKDGALRADGRYMSINQDEHVAEAATPFDQQIIDLGQQLNATYVAYGAAGAPAKERQEAQDANAASMGAPTSVQRSVAKAQAAYVNSGWDLVDAVSNGAVSIATLKPEDLPADMRALSVAQREARVKELAARRVSLQAQIAAAN
ncbi:MAG TPA: vWA domain-containing protein, partial [bacterium]|nr:vWA domain-containing protein [bacterium]